MKRLLSIVLLSLFSVVSAGIPSVDVSMFSLLTKDVGSVAEQNVRLATKDFWKTYPHNLNSGLVCYFDMPSVPRGMQLSEDFFVIGSMDSTGHLHLLHFMEGFPFEAVSLETFAAMLLNQFVENGGQVLYYKNTFTSYGDDAVDFAIYDPNESAFTKFRLVQLADGTLVWLFTVSKNKWDQHDRFVGSFHVKTY